MKRLLAIPLLMLLLYSCVPSAQAQEASGATSGRSLFEKYCDQCHPGGDNMVNPRKTLHKKDLDANSLSTVDALVNYMLNPGSGMPKLVHEGGAITIEQAKKVAAYILEKFSASK